MKRTYPIPDVDSLLKKIKKEKMFLHNLFEHDNGTWQANLRDINGNCTNYGFGHSPQEAIRNALTDTPRPQRQSFPPFNGVTKKLQKHKSRRRVRLD